MFCAYEGTTAGSRANSREAGDGGCSVCMKAAAAADEGDADALVIEYLHKSCDPFDDFTRRGSRYGRAISASGFQRNSWMECSVNRCERQTYDAVSTPAIKDTCRCGSAGTYLPGLRSLALAGAFSAIHSLPARLHHRAAHCMASFESLRPRRSKTTAAVLAASAPVQQELLSGPNGSSDPSSEQALIPLLERPRHRGPQHET